MSDDEEEWSPPVRNALAVYCTDCLNLHDGTRREHPARWLCMRAKRYAMPAYTLPDAIIGDPYERCTRINTDGNCEWFEPRRKKDDDHEDVR